ncbi:MFS transporter, DHA2 family, lincomycin resistance protein [Friedmanniella luteola]|uniref:MFS transporter, DHA2 family, lincomycin resistance protein n=1 Tax=Friedmanniella luteola TaxID=546871 RepID=A0A1H1L7P2_9ACTN|nr:MDR family MFS transporter [Friedmanniella luteola]SDR70065.1 MFS transporter, DHA2 family, lincomycin resistance protein [Friedmanniella luteola]
MTAIDRTTETGAGDRTGDGRGERLPAAHRTVIMTLLVATFVVILNETIMGVALPHLMSDLGVSASTVQWLSTAFLLTMGVVIPTTGFLLQRLATRTVFILAMSLFSTGTLLAAVSQGFWMLLAARVVQASGTAIMLPLLMTTILTLVPVARRGLVMGNVSIAISVAPAIGPTVSGIILQYLSWRFMFVIVLPIALAALVLGARLLGNVSEPGRQRLDVVSVLLSVPAFGGLVYGLSRLGESSGEGLSTALVFLAVGVLCLVAFGWRQLRLARGGDPLLDLRAFRFPMFSVSLTMLCIAMVALFGVIILLPIYLQNVRGLDSLQTGLLLLPGGLLMGLLGPVVGRLFDRWGPRGLSTFGSLLLVATLWRLSTVDAGTPVWLLVGYHLVMSLGLACLFTPAFTTALNPLPPSLYSHGSAILSTLQQVAGAAGTALLVGIMAGRSASLAASGTSAVAAQTEGLQSAFTVAMVVGLGAVACALFLRNDRPAGAVEQGGEQGAGTADAARAH